ncbi:MAG: hypothetical protein M3380_09515 [Chloroflexota bacterium]|nr:hypothetical protein [Chloroflexota bacterium]
MERGGMVRTVEVNPQPAQDHLHVLTTQVVCVRRRMQSGVTEPELITVWAEDHGVAKYTHQAAPPAARNLRLTL